MFVELTQHAAARANQRGVTREMLEDFIAWADREAAVGDGCTVLRVSRRRLQDRDLRGQLRCNPDKLASLAVIWSEVEARVVTIMVDRGKREGRRYRGLH